MSSFCTRYLFQREVTADNILLKTDDNRQLQSVHVANCLEMLNQLSVIVKWSAEIFNNIIKNSEDTAVRIKRVQNRVEKLNNRAPDVERQFMNQSPSFFYDQGNTHVKSWRRKEKTSLMEKEMPFNREYAAGDVNRLRNTAMPLPDLRTMDNYMGEDDKQLYQSCIKKYSMPEFFVNEWVKKEQARNARLKKERSRKRKKKRYGKSKRVIEAVERKQYISTGEKRTFKGKKTILEGDKTEFDVEEEYVGRRSTITESGLQPLEKTIEIRSKSIKAQETGKSVSHCIKLDSALEEKEFGGPPPLQDYKSGNRQPVLPPAPSVSKNTGPTSPTVIQSNGPPQPSSVHVPQPYHVHFSEDDMPEDMKRFKKMFGITRNSWAVINRMQKEGYTEEHFKKWIDPTHIIAAPPNVKKESKKKQSQKTPRIKLSPKRGGSGMIDVLADVRAGGTLKNVEDRQLNQLPKPEPDGKTQFLKAIEQGTKLRKVNRNRKKQEIHEVEDAMAKNPIMALLRMREKWAMTDSEDESSEDSSSNWED